MHTHSYRLSTDAKSKLRFATHLVNCAYICVWWYKWNVRGCPTVWLRPGNCARRSRRMSGPHSPFGPSKIRADRSLANWKVRSRMEKWWRQYFWATLKHYRCFDESHDCKWSEHTCLARTNIYAQVQTVHCLPTKNVSTDSARCPPTIVHSTWARCFLLTINIKYNLNKLN